MIALGCDHGGFAMMKEVIRYLDAKKLPYKNFGTFSEDSCDYPSIARPVCLSVTGGECDKGILICGTGIGMSMAANRFRGIRAALCGDSYSAEMTRRHNDANILVLGGRVIGCGLMEKILETFLETPFEAGRHARRIGMLDTIDAPSGDQQA
jgi:ribose 5-phosphate isomerase B